MRAAVEMHQWRGSHVQFAAKCWQDGFTMEAIADALAERFGVFVSKNSVSGLTRRHRAMFPPRVTGHPRQVEARRRSEATREF